MPQALQQGGKFLKRVWDKVQATKENFCNLDAGMFQQIFTDQLGDQVWVDCFRAHDNYVLHWLKSLDYTTLVTDFGALSKGALGDYQCMPPKGRMDILEAREVYTNFWKGRLTLKSLLSAHGPKVVMLFPEKNKYGKVFLALLQRQLLELHQETSDFMPDWELALLINIHRLPMDQQNQEMIPLGLNMVKVDPLHMCMWPFVDQITFLKHPRLAQFGAGYYNPQPVQRASYFGVIQMSSKNTKAKQLIENMVHGRVLNMEDHPGIINWGTLRFDEEHTRTLMKTQPLLNPILPTWEHHHSKFPEVVVQGLEDDVLQISTGWRISLDFNEDLRQTVKDFFRNIPVRLSKKIQINHADRLSYGSWAPDKMLAFDITLDVDDEDGEQAMQLSADLWDAVAHFRPVMGFLHMLNIDSGSYYVILEYAHSDALRDLMDEEVIGWCLIISQGMAVASPHTKVTNMEGLDSFVAKLIKYNQKFGKQKVSEGAKFFERVVLSEEFLSDTAILMKTQGGRLYWSRYVAKERKTMYAQEQVTPPTVVKCLLHNFHYNPDRSGLIAQLEKKVLPVLLAEAISEKAIDPQDFDDQLVLVQTGNPNQLHMRCCTQELAKYFSTKKLKVGVRQKTVVGTIYFKSDHFIVMKDQWQQHFHKLSIKDATPEFYKRGPAERPAFGGSTAASEVVQPTPNPLATTAHLPPPTAHDVQAPSNTGSAPCAPVGSHASQASEATDPWQSVQWTTQGSVASLDGSVHVSQVPGVQPSAIHHQDPTGSMAPTFTHPTTIQTSTHPLQAQPPLPRVTPMGRWSAGPASRAASSTGSSWHVE